MTDLKDRVVDVFESMVGWAYALLHLVLERPGHGIALIDRTGNLAFGARFGTRYGTRVFLWSGIRVFVRHHGGILAAMPFPHIEERLREIEKDSGRSNPFFARFWARSIPVGDFELRNLPSM